jgi:hypothetical protein
MPNLQRKPTGSSKSQPLDEATNPSDGTLDGAQFARAAPGVPLPHHRGVDRDGCHSSRTDFNLSSLLQVPTPRCTAFRAVLSFVPRYYAISKLKAFETLLPTV